MPIRTADTKEGLPEALRATAIETKDGKWVADEPVDVAALRAEGQRALEAERERANTEEKERKRLAKELADNKRTQDARDKGISEEELQKIRDAEALARKPIEDENARLKAENDKLKRTDRLKDLYLSKYGGMKDRVEDAMLTLDKRTELGNSGGIVYKDKEGKVTADDDAAFFKNLKAEKPWLFEGPGGSGSGATNSDGGTGGGYDPVAAGTAAGAKQKQEQAASTSLAFK